MTNTRILFLVIGLAVAFVVFTVLTAPAPRVPPLSVRGAAPDGALALRLWLEESGYETRELTMISGLDDADVLFVLNPLLPYVNDAYSEANAAALADWVRAGGRLIVSGYPYASDPILEPFNVRFEGVASSSLEADALSNAAAPTLLNPPFEAVRLGTAFAVLTDRADAVPHVVIRDQPVVVSFNEGRGQVWLVGALLPFTNQVLQEEGAARLIANLMNGVPRGAVVAFDEAVHGFGGSGDGVPSFNAWLFTSAPGWGVIALIVFTFAYLALRGRRFGRAEPLPEDRPRREAVEYIQAMAGLFRRSGGRDEILAHYGGHLRRRLSERYGVDPRAESNALARMVAERDPAVDEQALAALLRRLERRQVSENELIAAAGEVDRWLQMIT